MKRPNRLKAEAAARAFLREMGHDADGLTMVPDGEDGWAFWLRADDTTSYVHADLSVEWYGTIAELAEENE